MEALKYIRNIVGYDDYLKQYANFRKASLEGYLEIAEEITQFANVAEDTESFLKKLREMENEMAQKNKKVGTQQVQGVTLSTMHSAKGLEFEVVFVLFCFALFCVVLKQSSTWLGTFHQSKLAVQ